jgi:hypothetical protein
MRFMMFAFWFVAGLGCGGESGGSQPVSDDGSSGTGGGSETGSDDGQSGGQTQTSGGTDTGGPDAEEPFVSGSRLRAVVHRNDVGDEVLWRWHDTELDLDCVLLPTGDGERRCLPFSFASIVYADPQCTEEAVALGCDTPEHVVRAGFACYEASLQYEVSQVGSAVSEVYCLDGGGQCQPCNATNAHRVTPVDIEQFAAATASLREFEDGLARIEVEGQDGSAQWIGPFDAKREAFCGVTNVEGAYACVSYHRASVAPNVHRDPSCQSGGVAVDAYGPDCDTPDAVVADGVVATIGDELSDADLYSGTGPDDCEAGAGYGPSLRLFEIVPAAADLFPAASIEMPGSGRLRPRMVHDGAGALVSVDSPSWYDEQLQSPCYATRSVEDTWVCAPAGYIPAPTFFADAGCTTPLLRAATALTGWWSLYETAQCNARVEAAVRFGSEYDGPVYDAREGGCEPLDEPTQYAPFWVFDEVVPAAALAVIEQQQQ